MTNTGFAGFWSYTHRDDELDQGRVLRLADRLRDEYALLTGEDLRLFVDRDDLSWGDEWRSRIDEALEGTAFFIPVITPRYFASAECRKELLRFSGHAKSLGVEELLLPILYTRVPEMEGDEIEDEAVALIAKTQYEDWRTLRLEDEDSPVYRQAVNRLASRLAEIAERVSQPSVEEIGQATPAVGEPADAPGFLDLMAVAEEAMPRWTSTIEQFGPAMEALAAAAEMATVEMEKSDARGAGFGGRLNVARLYAAAVTEPAEEILELGSRYAADLVEIDPAIRTLIRHAEEEEPEGEELDSVCELFASMQYLVRESRSAVESLEELIASMRPVEKMTKIVRAPHATIRKGLRNVTDGQAVLEEWDRLIREAGIDCSGHAGGVADLN